MESGYNHRLKLFSEKLYFSACTVTVIVPSINLTLKLVISQVVGKNLVNGDYFSESS